MGGGAGAKASGVQRLPLATGAEDEQNGIHAHPVRGAWSATAETVGILVRGQQNLDALPQVIGNPPVIGNRSSFHAKNSIPPQLSKNKCSCTGKL
jgi:hypothetical protein